MSTTVGHAICGIASYFSKRKLAGTNTGFSVWTLLLFIFLANLPDLDMLVSYMLTGNPLQYHGQVSHSLIFICITGFIVMYVVESKRTLLLWLLYTLPLASHLLLDSLTGPDIGFHDSRGIALLWPFEVDRISFPVTIMNGPRHDTWERLFSLYNIKVVLLEIVILTPVAFFTWLMLWRKNAENKPD